MTILAKVPEEDPNGKIKRFSVDFEVKEVLDDVDDGFFRFEGLASTFGNIDLVDDIVDRGAFTKSISETTPIILWQHDSREPIGMPEEVKETDEGLFIRVRLPKDDSLVKGRVMPQIRIGSIRKMSIGYRIVKFDMDNTTGIRHLIELKLHEVSLVTFPANPRAKVTGFKSMYPILEKLDLTEDQKKKATECLEESKFMITKDDLSFLDEIEKPSIRDMEKALRDSGLFTKSSATKLVSFLNQSDSDEHSDAEILEGLKSLSDELDDILVQHEIKSMLGE